ncbi:IS110 family transposase [Sinorhizobium meliloti]|uniref:IS110 family transposase n=1 Tax=Rhizobium meliloti TaxID=382 RepID=UPI001F268886|nr:IS110 family transposase [Sinorhizobium meliloti]
MPELGRVDREEIAALTGVAPYDDQSGKREGERHIAGGRARVRRALFNAALPASQRWNETLVELVSPQKANPTKRRSSPASANSSSSPTPSSSAKPHGRKARHNKILALSLVPVHKPAGGAGARAVCI